MITRPSSGGSSPPRTWSRVLLPQPLGPMKATNSPRATSSDTPASTSRGSRLMRYALRTPSTATTVPAPSWEGEAATACSVKEMALEDGLHGVGQEALGGVQE